jgi:uncharacterized protein YjbI with pentapeptide repeats
LDNVDQLSQGFWPRINEELEAAIPEALEEAPTLRPEDLRNADLTDRDLTKVKGLLPEHLAGAGLTRAKLPDEIAKFPALGQVAAISSEARKIFIGLLAACVYSWLVIGTTKDVQLIVNTATSPLPIINTPIPIASFYVVGAGLLAAVYCYFHFYLQRLWRTLATLPAVFPDGAALDDKTDPWLLTNLVRANFNRLRRESPPLTRLETLLTILLAWWLVPLTILALWARYLPAHYWLGTTWLVALIGITALFGRHSYRLAGATLRGKVRAPVAKSDEGRGVSRRAWQEFRQIRPDRLTCGLTAVVIVCSLSAFHDNPRDPYTWVAKGLNAVGIRTYADLREVNVAERPESWDGKDWSKVKQVDLRGRNLAFAQAGSAFLANADLRWSNLTGADLSGAQLQGADLNGAQLQGADLSGAQLQGIFLRDTQLQGADLWQAQLQGAVLWNAQLQGAELWEAQLQGAVLSGARLQGADLSGAQLQGAHLYSAQLEGAVLAGAQLQGADLGWGTQLQGANLRETALWRASVLGVQWDYADLRGTNVQPMSESNIDALVTEAATKGIPEEKRGPSVGLQYLLYPQGRKALAERLNARLRAEKFPARPNLPEEWRSEPNVMFDRNDPRPEPFDWARPKWTTENAYDEDLATFLGDLACASDAPEASTQGLARRALDDTTDYVRETDRMWRKLFATRLVGPDCPPAKRLPDDMRRKLEALAARHDTSTAAPETVPRFSIE